MPGHRSNPSKPSKASKPSRTSKVTLTDQLRELPTDVLVDLIERHAKTVPALKQEMMRLVGNDKTVIAEIQRAIKKLAAVKPNTRSRPKEIQTQLVSVLELIKHVAIRRPPEALELLCNLLDDASNVASSFSPSSVVATFFRTTLPAVGAAVIARCKDEVAITTALRPMLISDPHGTKAFYLQGAGDALSETLVAELRADFTRRIKPKKYDWMNIGDDTIAMLKALEVSVGNTSGYEKAARMQGPLLNTDALVLAQMHVDHEAYDEALRWLDMITVGVEVPAMRATAQKRDELYVQISKSTGSTTHAASVFRARMLTQPSKETVDALRALLGNDGMMTVLTEVAEEVAKKSDPTPKAMMFFVANGYDDVMEERMLRDIMVSTLDLELLPRLAHVFTAINRPFGALLTYRWFVEATLSTSSVGMYDEAARAIRMMYTLSKQISDWSGTETHEVWVQELRQTYAKKDGFWRTVDMFLKYRF